MTNALLQIEHMLDQLTEEELRLLNRQVVERLKLIHKAHHLTELAKFRLRDRVYFMHHDQRIIGTVKRLNQKTVSVDTDDGHGWNVAPALLHKFIDESAEPHDTTNPAIQKIQPTSKNISRNQPCPCGSGKKYKKCCLQ